MITSKRALELIMRNVTRLSRERRPLEKSLGFALARDVRTPIDFPPFDRSAMDGYAVAEGKAGSVLTVAGEVCAGQRPRAAVRQGEAVRIMTGAMLPPGTMRVVMKENVELLEGGKIRIKIGEGKDNINRKGQDVVKGSVLYRSGQIVTPVVLANIAAAGFSSVHVYRKSCIASLVTGNELLKPGAKYEQGKIYNSNGPMLRSLLIAHGLCDVKEWMAADTLSALVRALERALASSDCVLITGGVSVGDYDFVERALDALGCRIYFNRVSIQPGKPFTFATHGKTPIFAFPGNPAAVFVTYFLFALPALMKMSGIEFEQKKYACAFRGIHSRRNAEREQFLPVRFVRDGVVEAVPFHGSGDLYALSSAHGLAIVPSGKAEVLDGEKVEVVVTSI